MERGEDTDSTKLYTTTLEPLFYFGHGDEDLKQLYFDMLHQDRHLKRKLETVPDDTNASSQGMRARFVAVGNELVMQMRRESQILAEK